MTEARSVRTAAVQIAVLVALCGLAFRDEIAWSLRHAVRDSDAAHLFAAPLLAGLLLWIRRDRLRSTLDRGSPWGIVVIVLTIAVLAVASWPFNFALPRRFALIAALGGAVLAVGGWRFLGHVLPALLVLLLAIPLGARYYAFLTIGLETVTLQVVRGLYELLPGVTVVTLEGPDLTWIGDGARGTIALGEPHRGAALLLACLTVVVFVAFARVRPRWQIAAFAIGSIPIVLIANGLRLFAWGPATLLLDAEPTAAAPRMIAAVVALLAAWTLAALLGWLLARLVVTAEPEAGS